MSFSARQKRLPRAISPFVRGLSLLAMVGAFLGCSDSSDPARNRNSTGSAMIQVVGLMDGASTGGTARIDHTDTTVPDVQVTIPGSGFSEISNIPTGRIELRYTPPGDHQVVPGQSSTRYLTIKKGQSLQNEFSVQLRPGRVRVEVVGLQDGSADGGVATITHPGSGAEPVTLTVLPSGTGQLNNVMPGEVRAEYTVPFGHRSPAGDSTWREGVVYADSTLPFSFGVEPTTGTVEVQVSGLDSRVAQGGQATIKHSGGPLDSLQVNVPSHGLGRVAWIPEGPVQVTYHPPAAYELSQETPAFQEGVLAATQTLPVVYSVQPQFGLIRVQISAALEGILLGGTVTVYHIPGTVDPLTVEVDETGILEIPEFPIGDVLVRYSPPSGHSLAGGEVASKRLTLTEGQTEEIAYSIAPVSNSIELEVTRLESGQGSVLVSNGIPLRPGDIMPGELDHVRLTVDGVEQAIHIEALRGKHLDGSLRSILVQFDYAVPVNNPLEGSLEWGSDVNRAHPALDSRPPVATPSAVALPVDPNYLVATGITLHPALTEAEARAELAFSSFVEALNVFRRESDAHWNAYGADFNNTTQVYDRALNHFTFWAMTGDLVYWERAVANTLAARAGSTNTPQTSGVAPRYYQPEGMGIHYWLTGDTQSMDYLLGGITRISVLAQHNPTNLAKFGIPPAGYKYNEGRIRARVLLGSLWAWLLEDTSQDWGARADAVVQGMLAGQNSDGSFTYRLGTDNTSAANLRYGQSNYMEGMAIDALAKYFLLRNPDPAIIPMVKKMVDFLDSSEWASAAQAWHYWSPAAAYDIGDSHVGLGNTDELNVLITIGHFWIDHMMGTSEYRARGDQAFAKTFGPGGADFGTTWGRKVFNQAFMNGLAQMYYRQR